MAGQILCPKFEKAKTKRYCKFKSILTYLTFWRPNLPIFLRGRGVGALWRGPRY